jgi:hypothetical protein
LAQNQELPLVIEKPDWSRSIFVDFDVEREDWNRFRLKDGTLLRGKLVMFGFAVNQDIEQLAKKAQSTKKLKIGFGFRSNVIYGAESPTNLRGLPDSKKYTNDELKESTVEKVDFETVRATWNSYLLTNGMQVKTRMFPNSVCRTSKFDEAGMPVYWVETAFEIEVNLPERIQTTLAKAAQTKKSRSHPS